MKFQQRLLLTLALLVALTGGLTVSPAVSHAGSGYYDYGVHGGYYVTDGLPEDIEGGLTLGFSRGLYFIKDALALAIDYVGFDFGMANSDMDRWMFHMPTAGLGVGTGFGAFMIYGGGKIALFGLDTLGDDVTVSLLNPRAVGGIQVGAGPLLLRAEAQYGRVFRMGETNGHYTFNNFSLMLAYGFYSDFL